MRISRMLLVVITAALTLAVAAGVAAANRSLETTTTSTRATARALTFSEAGGGFEVICEVVLTIRLNTRIAKVAGTAAGSITAVEVRNCRGGSARVLAETLPWPVTYNSFTGTLPRIETVTLDLSRTAFLLEVFFGAGRCLYEGPAQGITGGGTTVTEIAANRTRTVPLKTNLGGFECPEAGRFAGTFLLSPTVGLRLV